MYIELSGIILALGCLIYGKFKQNKPVRELSGLDILNHLSTEILTTDNYRRSMLNTVYNHTPSRFINVTNNEQCPICFETNNTTSCHPSCCKHVFHATCIKRWAEGHSTCPVCRAEFK